VELIPAIDIRGGRCVQLVQGDYGREKVYGDDPVAMAARWTSLGAKRLHVVDLDAARAGRAVNDGVVRRIIEEAGVPVQVSGGVRNVAGIDGWVAAGAMRVIIGTLAVEQPGAVTEAVQRHGDRIAVAVDARDGRAAVKGWTEDSETPVDGFIREMARRGARHFIYTDIARDGMLQHLDFAALRRALATIADTGTASTLIYSGGVTAVEDVVALSEYELEGAIVGTALYDGRMDLELALAALATGNGTG